MEHKQTQSIHSVAVPTEKTHSVGVGKAGGWRRSSPKRMHGCSTLDKRGHDIAGTKQVNLIVRIRKCM